nr:PREDICTED: protein AF1q [Opisthocomus hoazin]
MLDTISSQYDSFIYLRVADQGLGRLAGERDRDRASQDISDEEDSLLQFNSFNFWRAPIASISSLDFDLI